MIEAKFYVVFTAAFQVKREREKKKRKDVASVVVEQVHLWQAS